MKIPIQFDVDSSDFVPECHLNTGECTRRAIRWPLIDLCSWSHAGWQSVPCMRGVEFIFARDRDSAWYQIATEQLHLVTGGVAWRADPVLWQWLVDFRDTAMPCFFGSQKDLPQQLPIP